VISLPFLFLVSVAAGFVESMSGMGGGRVGLGVRARDWPYGRKTATGVLVKGTWNQKADLRLGSLSKPICPPMSSTNSLAMASPSPMPPSRRVRDGSAWMNGWKRRGRTSKGMSSLVSVNIYGEFGFPAFHDASRFPFQALYAALPRRLPPVGAGD
jgi:hypothetical protein